MLVILETDTALISKNDDDDDDEKKHCIALKIKSHNTATFFLYCKTL